MRCRVPEFAGKLLVLAGWLIAMASPAAAEFWTPDPSGHAISRPLALVDDVTDPLFSVMMYVIDENLYGELSASEIDSVVTANGGSKLPWEVFAEMRRSPLSRPGMARVEIDLFEAVDEPIPYSLLGYNPGSIRSSQQISFLDIVVGDRSYTWEKDDERREVEIVDAHLYVIDEGFMEMDFDGWLDRMLGSKLDDMQVRAFLTFHNPEGERISLGMGLTKKGRGKTGAFDFAADKTLFPAPDRYLVVGREMRAEGLRILEEWRAEQAPADSSRVPVVR